MTAKTQLKEYLLVLALCILLYWVSCAPGLCWQDSGLIHYRVLNSDIAGFMGLALSHPLFYLLALATNALPFGGLAHKVNLVASIAGAWTVANVFLLLRLQSYKIIPCVVAATTLALTHTFWQHASMAETYTLWTALFTTELILLSQHIRTGKVRYLYLLGFFNGLALADHMLACIPWVCYLVYAAVCLRRGLIRGRHICFMVLLWVLGALPYEWLILKDMANTGDIIGTLQSAAFGRNWRAAVLNTTISPGLMVENLLYVLLNFPTPNLLLLPVGILAVTRGDKTWARIMIALVILFLAFAIRYTVADRYAFFIPFYCLAAICIGYGASWVINARAALAYPILAAMLLPVACYAALPFVARSTGIRIGTRGDVPYRDDLSYFLQPWKTGYRGADRFAQEALAVAGPNAVIYADMTTIGPLLTLQGLARLRPDVKVVNPVVASPGAPRLGPDTIDTLIEQRPIYTVSIKPGYCPGFIIDRFTLTRKGLLWQVTRERTP